MAVKFVVMADRNYADLAEMCITTIRHHHPGVRVVQLTDEKSPLVAGADEAWRCGSMYPGEPWYWREFLYLLGQMRAEPTAIIGSDTLICKPLDDVWESEFDVALTWRPGFEEEPYNLGISFCRNPQFFTAVFTRMGSDSKLRKWGGDQKAVAQEVKTGRWKVFELPCSEWNCSELGSDKIPAARMLHYKGERKTYMQKHFKDGIWNQGNHEHYCTD